MNSTKHFSRLLLIFTLILLSSCIQTITEPEDPIFKEKIDFKMNDVRQQLQCSGIGLVGKRISENGIITKVMEIQILNGKAIHEEKMDSVAKSIAQIVKSSLTDQNQYMIYKIKFIQKNGSGAITKETWQEISFPNKNL